MPRIVIDLDDTLTIDASAPDYPSKQPNPEIVEKLREYRAAGFEIVIYSARNMRTYNGSVGHITAHTAPGIIEWLKRHDIPSDELHIGKPWCGDGGFYVDDKAVRPDEFAALSYDDVLVLIGGPKASP